MRHTAEQLEMDIGGGKQQSDGQVCLSKATSLTNTYPLQANPFTGENDYEALSESTYNTEEDLSAPDLVDFSPVYRFCKMACIFDIFAYMCLVGACISTLSLEKGRPMSDITGSKGNFAFSS